MNKILLLIACALLMQYTLPAQSKLLVENYYYKDLNSIVPMIHVETKNDWYAELRYNYEDAETISLYAGKMFRTGNEAVLSFTPLLGYATGKFRGPSFGLNIDMVWKGLFFSSQNQYSLSVNERAESFFFSWTEVGYSVSDAFFTGITIQYTGFSNTNISEPGLFAGLSLKGISFPCYLFNPFQHNRYLVLGLNYEFSLKKKGTRKS